MNQCSASSVRGIVLVYFLYLSSLTWEERDCTRCFVGLKEVPFVCYRIGCGSAALRVPVEGLHFGGGIFLCTFPVVL